MMYKIRTHHQHPEGRVFSWLVLVQGIGLSMFFPIFPNFVKDIVGTDEMVSVFYGAMALIMLVAALSSTIILRRIERPKILKAALFVLALEAMTLIFINTIPGLAIIHTFRIWAKLFVLMSLALFVRDFAKDEELGREEGIFYKFSNIGYFIGPLLGGFLGAKFGYELVFLIASTIFFGAYAYFYHLQVIVEHPAVQDGIMKRKMHFLKNVKEFFSKPNRIKAYFVTMLMMFWAGYRNLYVPLYVFEQGYLENMSGLILAAGIIPFIFMEVKVGEFASKHGVRLPISVGFLIMAISLLVIFFSPFSLLNFALIALLHIGGAMVEPCQEYFLFKNLSKKEEDKLYGVYMTADPIAYFVAPTLGAVILIFLPFKFLFLVAGMIMLFASGVFWLKLKRL